MANYKYADYEFVMKRIADIKYSGAVLQWDQETYMPTNGSEGRGRQLATLAEIAHEKFTDPRTGDLLHELILQGQLSDEEKKNVQLTLEEFEKNKKLPAVFVRKMSETVNRSFHAWIAARRGNSFAIFESPLHEIIELKKQEADLIGYADHPYDALLNEYDKGLTVSTTDKLFTDLKVPLLELYRKIQSCKQVDNSFLQQHFSKQQQWDFGLKILKQMNFDFEGGRQDISEHPFTTSFSSRDVRLTTRVDEENLGNMLWSCIHEAGHGLYEQGLPNDQYGMPLGEYCSLSIHESQSRLWENNIGRGLAFWENNYPTLQEYFPAQLKRVSVNKFYKGINRVSPSLIRTESDEISYHLHVMIRYEIEKGLISGSLKCKDIPVIWSEFYQDYLAVKVPDDRLGCLQDVHWSHGSFGYFPTYSIGSLYAAQFYAAIDAGNPSMEKELQGGNSLPVLNWLQQHIYRYGRYYHSNELCERATGTGLDSSFFLDYAFKKYAAIYDFA